MSPEISPYNSHMKLYAVASLIVLADKNESAFKVVVKNAGFVGGRVEHAHGQE
jgi:hypothetical protein